MTIEELNDKHLELIRNPRGCSLIGKSHIKLSIEFAIEVLEEIVKSYKEDIYQETRNLTEWGLGYKECSLDTLDGLNYKIQELKQYLDE